MLYAVDTSATSELQEGQKHPGGVSIKCDLAARNGPEKNESEGSEVGRKGHFEEIPPTKFQRDVTSHPNFAIQYGKESDL